MAKFANTKPRSRRTGGTAERSGGAARRSGAATRRTVGADHPPPATRHLAVSQTNRNAPPESGRGVRMSAVIASGPVPVRSLGAGDLPAGFRGCQRSLAVA
jgi:hypothetical protein